MCSSVSLWRAACASHILQFHAAIVPRPDFCPTARRRSVGRVAYKDGRRWGHTSAKHSTPVSFATGFASRSFPRPFLGRIFQLRNAADIVIVVRADGGPFRGSDPSEVRVHLFVSFRLWPRMLGSFIYFCPRSPASNLWRAIAIFGSAGASSSRVSSAHLVIHSVRPQPSTFRSSPRRAHQWFSHSSRLRALPPRRRHIRRPSVWRPGSPGGMFCHRPVGVLTVPGAFRRARGHRCRRFTDPRIRSRLFDPNGPRFFYKCNIPLSISKLSAEGRIPEGTFFADARGCPGGSLLRPIS